MSAINIPATMLDGRGERDTSGERRRRIEMVGALVAVGGDFLVSGPR